MGSKLLLGALTAVLVYFAWNALAGRHGLSSWVQVQAETERAKAELARWVAANDALASDIARLQEGGSASDAREASARQMLGFAAEGEIIVRLPVASGAERPR